MKTILIPSDFSRDSDYTIRYVLDFLQDMQSSWRILVVNTFKVPSSDPKQIIIKNDELKFKSKEGLERVLSETKKLVTNPNITIETGSYMGSLNNIISQIIDEEKVDLVAMGKDGGRHVESVTSLLKKKGCPLMITFMQ